MVNVSILGDRAVFDVEGLDQLWAFRSRLEIPLTHITGVAFDPEQARGWYHGLRLLGTNMPGVLAAGTFYHHGELVFWDVHDPASTVIVSLNHEHYKKLICQVADPEAVVRTLRTAPDGSQTQG